MVTKLRSAGASTWQVENLRFACNATRLKLTSQEVETSRELHQLEVSLLWITAEAFLAQYWKSKTLIVKT